MKAKAIMIQGTASNAGKTLLAAGLCRIFRQEGYSVAPFKSQNMALNSYITREGLEMGRAQVMQAEACGLEPDVRMNPILLKPTSDHRSQVIVNGEVLETMDAAAYFHQKPSLLPHIQQAYQALAAEHDIIVLEGAGSPAEINLKEGDLVNMGMAKLAQAPVLLAGDIDRGGVFAALAGTMLLLNDDEKALVKGVIINKFRGDVDILRPGLAALESIIQKPVLGVVPYLDLRLDDEDSLTGRFAARSNAPDPSALVDIAVLRLPRIANFTDFNALELLEGFTLRYVASPRDLGAPDLLLVPGSKNTMADLTWLRQSGLADAILRHAGANRPIIGVCGGFQMLGQKISDPYAVEEGGEMPGLGLLPHTTLFGPEKKRVQIEGTLSPVKGIFRELSGQPCRGYEIHMGRSDTGANLVQNGNVYGTYIHGFFDLPEVTRTIARALLKAKGLDCLEPRAVDMRAFKETQYDLLADALRRSLDLNAILNITEKGI